MTGSKSLPAKRLFSRTAQDCGLGVELYGFSIVQVINYRKYQYLILKIYLIYYVQTKNFAPVLKCVDVTQRLAKREYKLKISNTK